MSSQHRLNGMSQSEQLLSMSAARTYLAARGLPADHRALRQAALDGRIPGSVRSLGGTWLFPPSGLDELVRTVQAARGN
jgi:hypothetical protein